MFLKNFIQPKNDTVDTKTTLQEVVNIMSNNKLHHIIIIKENKPVGIITEKDIVRLFKNNIDFEKPAINYATKNIITLHGTRLVQYALSIMIDNNIRKIVVIDSKNEYLGCIEQEEIVYRFEEELHVTNITIQQLLNSNNKAVIIDENENLKFALDVMTKENLTSLLISKNSNPIGILSESDILHLAKDHINVEKKVKEFMHSPIIEVDIKCTLSNMIEKMKKNNIRRIVVNNNVNESYHILNSKDLVNNIKGNYTNFLESKLYDTRDTFNALSEYVIELLDFEDEQVIYWTNSITTANFFVNIDDEITKIIPENTWGDILKKLKEDKTYFGTIQIKENYYMVKAHYGTILNNNIIKIFLNDITEITKLNQELKEQNELQKKLLFEQAKMAQMGEMIGNIAHQWRQPLNGMSISASGMQLKKDLDDLSDEEFNELTNIIINNAEYLSSTIDIFRNFIKEKKEKKELILQERLDIAISIVNTSLKSKHIELVNYIDYTDLIKKTMVTGELDQVIINILNNAKDVLLERNIIDPWIKICLYKEDNNAIITVEDNGSGIDESILSKVFEQYFTTKDQYDGTGLGLYMSHKIITESLNGTIDVENTNFGAKFTITLPLDL